MALIILAVLSWPWWPTGVDGSTAPDSLGYTVGVNAVVSSGRNSPFWISAGRDGTVSGAPMSASAVAGLHKPATNPGRWFDYDFGVNLYAGYPESLYTDLGYAHVRLFVMDITAGVKPLSFGPADESLSLGGLLFSRNARPMPRITIGIDNYTPIPGFFGYAELRGGISHMIQNDAVYVRNGFVHHKFIGLRLGGPLPVNLSYEFHHAAQWGGYLPDGSDLGNTLRDFWNVFKASSGGSYMIDKLNAQGNHLCSQLLRLDVKWPGWNIAFYWQNLQEDGPIRLIGETMNAPDGLWGVNVCQNRWPYVSGFSLEYLNTTDQSGPWHDKDGYIFGGRDSYYSNGLYRNGWTHFRRTIGSPLLNPLDSLDRVSCFMAAFKGAFLGVSYRAVCSYARNYDGPFATSPSTSNLGWMLELDRTFPALWGLEFGIVLSGDHGNQFGNCFGAMFSIKKKAGIHKW